MKLFDPMSGFGVAKNNKTRIIVKIENALHLYFLNQTSIPSQHSPIKPYPHVSEGE